MFKFLDPTGCTYYDGEAFQYNLPGRDEIWARTDHPDPAIPDGAGCGPGRLHLKKSLSFRLAPVNAWPWWARGEGLIGEDESKASFATVYLRRISPEVLARMLRPPFNWGRREYLRALYLPSSDLRGANLQGAMLYAANLRFADLTGANLAGCDLRQANLFFATLEGAVLRGAMLDGAYLPGMGRMEGNKQCQ